MFANRANVPISKIREILSALPNIKAKREKDDPEHPLIDISIGDPHIAPNPYVMTKLREMTATRTSLGPGVYVGAIL